MYGNKMFSPIKSRFNGKEDKIDSIVRPSEGKPIKAQIRQCKKCGSHMHVIEQIRTIYFIFPVPGLKYKFECIKCSKEMIIRSPVRFFLTLIFAVIIIAISLPLIIYEVQNMISGISDKSSLLYLIIILIVISIVPIDLIADIYKYKKYPILQK